MNTYLSCILVLISVQFLFSDSPLSNRYHTYSEIDSTLHAWNDEFGSDPTSSPYYDYGSGIIYKLIDLGVSTQDELPFWAVKLSFNADIDEDDPRSLILGQCHAEEILGVEISMELIYMFLHPDEFPSESTNLTEILYKSEVWIIPTYNPEGLSVVHGWEEDNEWFQDVSYRKNKMDANYNGIFDFDTNGYGNDIDGVDLNRNYDFNWIFGDEFLESDEGCPSNPSYVSNYDYYRGEYPFSESEVSVIKNLALQYNFVLSIAYHSSRSGCVAERVIYPWLWGGIKTSPDYNVIQTFGQEIAELTLLEGGSGNYHFAGSSSPKGNAHDWFYSKTGCIQYLIEVGTENMQPDDIDLIEDTIGRNLPGAFYLMKRAAGINGPDKHQVTGIVYDSETGEPLEGVEVIVENMKGGVLSPRLTDDYGRYRRLLVANSYNLLFKKHGYEDYIQNGYVPSADNISPLDIQMIPKEFVDLVLTFEVPQNHSNPIDMHFYDESGNHYSFSTSNQEISISLPVGWYYTEIISEGLFPSIELVSLYSSWEEHLTLAGYNVVFQEDFDDLDDWEIIFGDWNVDDGRLLSQEDLVYLNWTPAGDIRIDSEADIFSVDYPNRVLQIQMKYEVEWDYDTLFVDIIGDENSQRIFSRFDQSWEDKVYNIPIPGGETNYEKISIGINRDLTIGYRGVSIESLKLIEACFPGDLNHDGQIDVTDIILLVDVILGNSLVSEYLDCNIDANQDQLIDVLDVIRTINVILGD